MIRIMSITQNPLTTMGEIAGVCYNTTNAKAFPKIAKRCLEEGHGRVSEFANVTIEIDGYSAKLIRELYTHISGTSRVQSSTRYIDYSNQFQFVTPPTVQRNEEASAVWYETMTTISEAMNKLKDLGIPVEDLTNVLPLAYTTKMVLQINVRALIHMFHVRACTCAYHEFRVFMNDLKSILREQGEEWAYLCDNYFVAKCIASGYCEEITRHCGVRPKKGEK
ncbi:MAG: FAD-dependent thymidylate synthase [Fusobacteriaceae bacterium]